MKIICQDIKGQKKPWENSPCKWIKNGGKKKMTKLKTKLKTKIK